MKKYYVLLTGFMLAAGLQTQAQTKIGGTGAPDNSAMLEVTGGTGNNKGILPPRLTTTQRDAIANPASGLIIYNTTAAQLQVNTGTPGAPVWTASASGNGWTTSGNAGTIAGTNFIGTTDNQALTIRTNNTENVRVTATGNVGVGTVNPSSKLEVANGGATISNTAAIATPALAITNNGGGEGLSDDITITSYGASTAPAFSMYTSRGTLSTPANAQGNDFAGILRFGTQVNGAPTVVNRIQSVYVGDGTTLKSKLSFTANGSSLVAMTIDSSGYIGIGTATPQQTLHVAGTARITGSDGTATTIMGRDAAGDVSNIALGTGLSLTGGTLSATVAPAGWNLAGNAGTNPATNYIGTTDAQPLVLRTGALERMRVSGNGNVGIGNVAPLSPLSFASATSPKISLYDAGSTTDYFGLGISNNQLDYHVMPNGVHAFFVGGKNGDGTELMRIQANGNVGIGTSNPAYAFQMAKADYGAFGGLAVTDNDGANASSFTITPGYIGSIPFPGSVTLDVPLAGQVAFSDPIQPSLDNSFSNGTADFRWNIVYSYQGNFAGNVTAASYLTSSDRRLKTNISDMQNGLSSVMALRPVSYDKKKSISDHNYDRHEMGFIAQEIQKVLPSIVTEGKDANKILAVSYTELIPVLTKAIQEQQAQIDNQHTQIETLKAENAQLKDSKAVTAQLMERVKQMEQMMGIKEIEGNQKVAGK